MMIRFYGMALGLCLALSTGLRAQDSLMLQIEAALNAPEPSAPELSASEKEYHSFGSMDSLNFNSPFPAMSRFTASINGGGLAIFGPMMHAEIGLTQNLRLDTHIRYLNLGIAYQFLHTYTDIYSLPAPGLGLVIFYPPYEMKRRLYIYLGGEYAYYQLKEYSWDSETYYSTYHLGVAGGGAGYRFRFSNGIFFNFGGYAFYGWGHKWHRFDRGSSIGEWEYSPYELDHIWFQADIRVGFEFPRRLK